MKRALLFIFMTVCVLGMSACSSKDAMPERDYPKLCVNLLGGVE